MQDAFGGILNLVFIVIFLLIVEGILGLTVAYTKAFRMKNYIISVIEEYDGYGCLSDGSGSTACRKKITEKACEMGYKPTSINCGNDDNAKLKAVSESVTARNGRTCYYSSAVLACVTNNKNNNEVNTVSNNRALSYHVRTQVDINIPIVNNIFGFSFFQINGDTRTLEQKSS